MDETQKLEAITEWWNRNALKPWADWEAMVELGGILKEKDDNAEDYDYPMSEHVRRTPVSPEPVVWKEPEPYTFEPAKKLDPMPYVQFYGTAHEERFSATDPMRVRGSFKPRPGFEQDRKRYDESLRIATRRRGV